MRAQLKLVEILLRYLYVVFDRMVFYGFDLGPLRRASLSTASDFTAKGNQAKNRSHPEVDDFEKNTGVAIDAHWLNDLALLTQITCKSNEVNYQHGRILYSTLGSYLSSNRDGFLVAFETGSARGFSSIIMSKALSDYNRAGVILTLDVIPHNKPIFWSSKSDLEVGKLTRKKMLRGYKKLLSNIIFLQGYSQALISKIGIERINFAFLDGAHNQKALIQEYEFVAANQDIGDILIIDDVENSLYQGIMSAFDKIKKQNLYEFKNIRSSDSRVYSVGVRVSE
jgi:hypothetical protein